MVFKRNISSYKQKIVIFLSVMFIALLLQPRQTVYASELSNVDWSGFVSSIVNSTHSNNEAGTTEIPNGVSVSRTGYLAYMVNKETGAPTSEAKAFYAGTNWIPGSQWIVSSRHGGLNGGGGFTGQAEWGQPWIPPAKKGDPLTSLEPNIKDWFRTNGSSFVHDKFPANHSNFVADTEVLILETIMNVQFSTGNSSSQSPAEAADRIVNAYPDVNLLLKLSQYGYPTLLKVYKKAIDEKRYEDAEDLISQAQEIFRNELISYYTANGTGDESSRTFHGLPVIGTVPNLLAYDQWNTIVFDSYLNKGAPQAEKIYFSEAGFTAYQGSGKMTDADVQNYGVAMIIIHCTDPAQTTCDEPKQPTPHQPPIESTGKVTIVKSYRTKNMTTGELVDNGTFHQGDLGTQILIENETEYQVIDWKTSTTTNTGISSLSWESSVPSIVQQQGKTPTSVTLQPTETCLYVLLERLEDEPPEELDWNYLMTQSTITRRIWMNTPDNSLTNMVDLMKDFEFRWIALAHANCPGHTYYDKCQTTHDAPCDCSGLCPSSCTDKHHEPDCLPGCTTQHDHKKCETTHKQKCNTPDDCLDQPRKALCGTDGWEWIDNKLRLSINNELQNSYPDILATKKGWNAEVLKGGVEKRFYGNGQIERTKHSLEEHKEESEITNWDYVCVLLRGKDKLTVAQWQNNGDNS